MAKYEQVLAAQKLGLLLFQMSGGAKHSWEVQVIKGNEGGRASLGTTWQIWLKLSNTKICTSPLESPVPLVLLVT